MKNGPLGGILLVGLAAMTCRGAAQDASGDFEKSLQDLRQRIDELEVKLKTKEAEETVSPGTFHVFWKDGVRFQTEDKNFFVGIGGRIQNDWAFMAADDELETAVGDFDDGVEFRRARLYIYGKLYNHVEFKAEYDFAAGGHPSFTDVFVGLFNLPAVGGLRVGHFKEPFGMEELTSSRFIPFLERSLPVLAFSPSRNTGAMFHHNELDGRLTWAAGVFRQTDAFGKATDASAGSGDYNVAARITGLPWKTDDGDLLHVGVSYQFRSMSNDDVEYRSKPESHLASYIVDTGLFDIDRSNTIDAEAGLVLGPVWIQSEYMNAFAARSGSPDAHFSGVYVSSGYFLTGERRAYKSSSGAFNRLRPTEDFLDGNGGLGAWEVALRYSYLDLNDEGIRGGIVSDVTTAINWYLNSYVRVMTNYVFSHRNRIGNVHIFQFRFQVDF